MYTLNLTRIHGYQMWSTDDERSGSVKGYYQDHNAAVIASKGAGWYGQNGDVSAVILYTDGNKIYKVEQLGQFNDITTQQKEQIMAGIKSKLSKEELEYLKIATPIEAPPNDSEV